MNNKEKFENFLESLKGKGQDNLVDNVKKGFHACCENSGMFDDALEQHEEPDASGKKYIHIHGDWNGGYMVNMETADQLRKGKIYDNSIIIDGTIIKDPDDNIDYDVIKNLP